MNTSHISLLEKSMHLCTKVDGWISGEELQFLLTWALISALNNQSILEIGSYKGKTTIGMATLYRLLALDKRLVALDPGDGQWVDSDEPTFDILRSNIAHFGLDQWVSLNRCEPDLSGLQLREQFGMAYIDGEHSLKSIRRDFWFATAHLNVAGYILVHDDYYHTYPDVWLHCRQVTERYGYRFLGKVGSLSAFQKLSTSRSA